MGNIDIGKCCFLAFIGNVVMGNVVMRIDVVPASLLKMGRSQRLFYYCFVFSTCTVNITIVKSRAVVVAQLVERLLPIPEVRGSNPVIGKFNEHSLTVNCIEKTKIKIKEAGNGPFFKKLSTARDAHMC